MERSAKQRAALAASFWIALAASAIVPLFVPGLRQAYARFGLERLGAPGGGVLLWLWLLGVLTVLAYLAWPRRRRLTLCVLASLFVHMLLALVCAILRMREAVFEPVREPGRRELAFGLPSLLETVAAESVRDNTLALRPADTRPFDARARTEPRPAEQRPPPPEPPLPTTPPPPDRPLVEPQPASKPTSAIEEPQPPRADEKTEPLAGPQLKAAPLETPPPPPQQRPAPTALEPDRAQPAPLPAAEPAKSAPPAAPEPARTAARGPVELPAAAQPAAAVREELQAAPARAERERLALRARTADLPPPAAAPAAQRPAPVAASKAAPGRLEAAAARWRAAVAGVWERAAAGGKAEGLAAGDLRPLARDAAAAPAEIAAGGGVSASQGEPLRGVGAAAPLAAAAAGEEADNAEPLRGVQPAGRSVAAAYERGTAPAPPGSFTRLVQDVFDGTSAAGGSERGSVSLSGAAPQPVSGVAAAATVGESGAAPAAGVAAAAQVARGVGGQAALMPLEQPRNAGGAGRGDSLAPLAAPRAETGGAGDAAASGRPAPPRWEPAGSGTAPGALTAMIASLFSPSAAAAPAAEPGAAVEPAAAGVAGGVDRILPGRVQAAPRAEADAGPAAPAGPESAAGGGRRAVRPEKATAGAPAGAPERTGLPTLAEVEAGTAQWREPTRLIGAAAETLGAARVALPDELPRGERAGAYRSVAAAELMSSPKLPRQKLIYSLRAPEKRRERIAELGGSAETEAAVERALAWLARAQSADGRWDVDGFKTVRQCGGAGDRKDGDVGVTGLALLAYLGAGYTHRSGQHRDTVRRGLDWLIAGQTANGDLRRGGQLYGQAMATAALCEAYSLTGDERLLAPARRAVEFICAAQNPGAGWRYEPREDSDTSVTGWQVLALKSAELAGIATPAVNWQWTALWLEQVRRGQQGGLYAYKEGHGPTPVMTAEGWFCQLFMSEDTRARGEAESVFYLRQHLPEWNPAARGTIHFYYWYYATLALHLSGAQAFEEWNAALQKALLQGQRRDGAAAGSWDPIDQLGERGGRLYATTMAALCLEVYYRYLPFYRQTER